MLMITSDPAIKTLLENGRAQRSGAFFGVLKRLWSSAPSKADLELAKRAAPKRCCPS